MGNPKSTAEDAKDAKPGTTEGTENTEQNPERLRSADSTRTYELPDGLCVLSVLCGS